MEEKPIQSPRNVIYGRLGGKWNCLFGACLALGFGVHQIQHGIHRSDRIEGAILVPVGLFFLWVAYAKAGEK
jgi:hypothetical protein